MEAVSNTYIHIYVQVYAPRHTGLATSYPGVSDTAAVLGI